MTLSMCGNPAHPLPRFGRKNFPVRYFIMASKREGIFNLGGDLATFAESFRKNDRNAFRRYGHAAIDGLYGLLQGFDLPIVTLA